MAALLLPGGAWPAPPGAVPRAEAAAGGTPAPAGPDGVAEKQKQLQALRQEIDANRQEIEKLRSREQGVSQLQGRIRRDRDLTARYLRELEAQDSTLRQGLADRQSDLLDKQESAHEAAERLKRGVVRYYKLRDVAGPELLFSSRSFGELFARAQFLARLVQHERIELAALTEQQRRISEDASVLEERRAGVEALQGEKRREQARLRQQGLAAQGQLARLADERAEKERLLRDLESSQAAIVRMIERLERERARAGSVGNALAFKGTLEGTQGRLPWPVNGTVVGGFGYEVSARYGTQVPSNGIDIAADAGTPIRAVGPGSVEFVDWLPGYGRTVILNHGSGYYTLYAHASSVAVTRGQTVTAGQVIGAVGDTDSIRGTCLHFEIRQGERALDPKEWLR